MRFRCLILCAFSVLMSKLCCARYVLNKSQALVSPPIDTPVYPEPNTIKCYWDAYGNCLFHPNITTTTVLPSTYSTGYCNSDPEWTSTETVWIYVSAGLLLLLLTIVVIGGILWCRRRSQLIARFVRSHGSMNADSSEPSTKTHTDMSHKEKRNDYIDQLRKIDDGTCKTDPWAIPSDHLKVFEHEKLGSGAFCFVYKGKLEGKAPISRIQPSLATQKFEDCEVAVKKLPEYADNLSKSDFIQEIEFMKRIGYHIHLVSMIGCIVDPLLDPCLVIEYCSNGDLLKYIRNKRLEIVEPTVEDESALRFKDLLSFAWQISDGMDFLSSKGCIHRDIAARNVLVDEKKVAKIGDFGLCRLMDSTIYTTRGGRLPIKWMAIESLEENEYSTKSDVWSYGVLLYELFSLGAVPYAWVQPSEMAEYLRSGKRLDKPQHCADNIYSIMQECWKAKPEDRPLFTDLKTKFATLLSFATEEYGYLDMRKSSSGHYIPLISNNNSSGKQVTGDASEANAPSEAVRKVEGYDREASCESSEKDVL